MTAPAYSRQVLDAFGAVTFTSADDFLWLGRQVAGSKPRAPRAAGADSRLDLVARLTNILYDAFYCSGGVWAADSDPPEVAEWASEGFVERLIGANAGGGFEEHGWEVRGCEGGRVTASRGGLTIATDWPTATTTAVGVGDVIALRSAKGSLSLSPGYYFAFGDAGVPEAGPVVRLYWNTTPEAGVELIRCVTRSLNDRRLPFGLKVLTNFTAYRRADSAVLYLAREVYLEAAGALIEIYRKVRPALRRATPVFTKTLAPGVGLAESPPDGASFGHQRSMLLAEAIAQAHEERAKSQRERSAIYEAVLRKSGLDPARPYLNSGSEDSYAAWDVKRRGARKTVRRFESRPAQDPLEVAAALGRRLSAEALWWEGRCTWLGIESDPDPGPETASTFCWGTLDPCLYSGGVGVGLFLAHLARATGERAAREAAEGALRQALSQLEEVPPESRFGYYTGWAGVAAATLEAARALNDDELCDAGVAVAGRLAREEHLIDDPRTELDLMGGKAGAVAAIATRRELAAEPALVAFAGRLAEQLLRDAVRCGPGLGWPVPRSANELPLAGMSHGASGIALALLELDRVSACAGARAAAEQAFAYERGLFDARRGNWPDLRGQSRRRRRWHEAHFLTAWCHGAPGIALARARAYLLLGDPLLHREFEIARETTRRDVAAGLRDGAQNCAPCHGVLGNAEVLALCGQMLGEPEDPLVDCVAARVSEGAGPSLQTWQSDFPGETPPGLLLGLAGAGMFYLRRACPQVPSPLMPLISSAGTTGDLE